MSRFNLFWLLRSSLLWNCLAIAACILTIVSLQYSRLEEIVDRESMLSLEQLQQEEGLEQTRLQLVKRMPAFGFDNLVANWTMLRFLQYFGDESARDAIGYSLVPDYFRIILDRDPRFLTAYTYLATSGAIHAAKPRETDEIMERGIQQLAPQAPKYSYLALRNKGINKILFIGDLEAARDAFNLAANWASTYDDPQSQAIAQQSRATVNFLSSRPSLQATQVAAWGMVLEQATDEETQKIAIENIYKLGGEIQQSPNGRFQVILPSNP